MSELPTQRCPICSEQVRFNARYPRYVCADCARRARDENGRALEFYNQTMSGGFEARYRDGGEPRAGHVCFIDGIECRADEARFGGIVIQVTE